jgi:hypothetical protein
LFICGVALSFSIFLAWNAKVLKAVGDLIQSLGVVMVWAMWITVAYIVFAWLGIVDRPVGFSRAACST